MPSGVNVVASGILVLPSASRHISAFLLASTGLLASEEGILVAKALSLSTAVSLTSLLYMFCESNLSHLLDFSYFTTSLIGCLEGLYTQITYIY